MTKRDYYTIAKTLLTKFVNICYHVFTAPRFGPSGALRGFLVP